MSKPEAVLPEGLRYGQRTVFQVAHAVRRQASFATDASIAYCGVWLPPKSSYWEYFPPGRTICSSCLKIAKREEADR